MNADTGTWRLWFQQARTLARHEIWRTFRTRRALPILLLTGLPIAFAVLRLMFMPNSLRADVSISVSHFSGMFLIFVLRFVVFFGCAAVFISLFRGEILERSLHYTLLAPVRREVTVLGKYAGGVIAALAVFIPGTILTWVLFLLAHGTGSATGYLVSTEGLTQLLTYLALEILAVLGYGAVFLLAGLLFRNPMVPAALLLGWESITPFLPPALKVFSVAHHLWGLSPLPVNHGPLAFLAEPTPAWLAVSGLLGVSAGLLLLAVWRTRRLEIMYSTE